MMRQERIALQCGIAVRKSAAARVRFHFQAWIEGSPILRYILIFIALSHLAALCQTVLLGP
jgi:hypothetical protein